MAVPSEVEAKFQAPTAGTLDAIARVQHLGAYRLRDCGALRLHTTYLDTADLTLTRHGVALRLRQQGRNWEATAKWPGRVRGAVHERPELTLPLSAKPSLPFALPSGPLLVRLGALVAGRPLQPVLVSEVHRRRLDILPAESANGTQPIAELALDRVHLRAPDRRPREVKYAEVEIELVRGTRQDLAKLTRALRRRFTLIPSADTKFGRGMQLLYGSDLPSITAPCPVRAEDTVAEATRKVFDLHLQRLRLHDPGTRLGQDPEAVHDMRVATRRLRAALLAFPPGLSRRLQQHLRVELQWLGRLLGGVRDPDVQLNLLERYRRSALRAHIGSLVAFEKSLRAGRARCHADLLAGLDSARYFTLLTELEHVALGHSARRLHTKDAREPIARLGRRAIRRAFRRLMKRGAGMPAEPTPHDLHFLRIRAKRARYLLEFLREITGKPGRRLLKSLVRLQDLLGAHNDAMVTARCVQAYLDEAGVDSDSQAAHALHALVDAELREAEAMRADFRAIWRRFARRTRKDLDAVKKDLRAMA